MTASTPPRTQSALPGGPGALEALLMQLDETPVAEEGQSVLSGAGFEPAGSKVGRSVPHLSGGPWDRWLAMHLEAEVKTRGYRERERVQVQRTRKRAGGTFQGVRLRRPAQPQRRDGGASGGRQAGDH